MNQEVSGLNFIFDEFLWLRQAILSHPYPLYVQYGGDSAKVVYVVVKMTVVVIERMKMLCRVD